MSDGPSGTLYSVPTAKSRTWKKYWFVLTGSRLRWYESKADFDEKGIAIARGELTVLTLKETGPRLVAIKDAWGKSDVIVRTDMGDKTFLVVLKDHVKAMATELSGSTAGAAGSSGAAVSGTAVSEEARAKERERQQSLMMMAAQGGSTSQVKGRVSQAGNSRLSKRTSNAAGLILDSYTAAPLFISKPPPASRASQLDGSAAAASSGSATQLLSSTPEAAEAAPPASAPSAEDDDAARDQAWRDAASSTSSSVATSLRDSGRERPPSVGSHGVAPPSGPPPSSTAMSRAPPRGYGDVPPMRGSKLRSTSFGGGLLAHASSFQEAATHVAGGAVGGAAGSTSRLSLAGAVHQAPKYTVAHPQSELPLAAPDSAKGGSEKLREEAKQAAEAAAEVTKAAAEVTKAEAAKQEAEAKQRGITGGPRTVA